MPRLHTLLFLNENPLPQIFTKGTISGKELRLRAALPYIRSIHVVCRRGDYVATHHQETSALEEKIIVHRLPPWPYYFSPIPLFFIGLYYALKLKPLCIEAESPILSGVAGVLIGRLTGIPTLVEVRASYSKLIHFRFKIIPYKIKLFFLNCVLHFTYRQADVIIANSQTYQRQLNNLGYCAFVINPGIQNPPNLSTYSFPPKDKSLVIGYLGRLVPEKGVLNLLEAIQLISTSGGTPKFRVEIAGAGADGDRLKTFVLRHHLQHLVSFIGQVDNFSTLAHWDILVNPCLVNHPLEMVNAEAAYMGVPVICYGNQTIPETVVDQVTGLKVAQKTAAALAKTLVLLLNNSALRKKLSANASHFALTHYHQATQSQKLNFIYHTLNPKLSLSLTD